MSPETQGITNDNCVLRQKNEPPQACYARQMLHHFLLLQRNTSIRFGQSMTYCFQLSSSPVLSAQFC